MATVPGVARGRQRSANWATAVALLLTFATACGDGDGPRTPTSPTTPTAPTNSVPVTSGSIPAQSLPLHESIRLDAAQYFSDPDGDALTYEATSSATQIATVTVTESTVILTGENVGQADIQVTARDPQGGTATQLFPVTVEEPGFTLSGTVRDGRRNGPLLAGAVVRLENGHRESTTTDPDGRYRFPNVSGTVTVTAAAEPSYAGATVEVTMAADRTVDFTLEHTGIPPYAGTVFITPDVLGPSDPTSLRGVTYAGRGQREIYDRRPDRRITVNAYLFTARYAGQELEFQVNPEFGSREAARAEVDTYAPALGRLPAVLLSGAREVEINAGKELFGGNGFSGSFLIHTDQGREYIRNGFLEEVFLHESGHVSLDLAHANSVGWRAAQEADGVFISDYARDFPDREDIAESILPYFAVRYWPERLSEADRAAILAAIPNRLAYFDEQGFDMSPYRARGSTTRVLGLRPFQPRRIWRPFEGPPSR